MLLRFVVCFIPKFYAFFKYLKTIFVIEYMLKRFFKILGYFLLTIILLIVIGLYLLTKEKYQNMLVKKATAYLSEKLHTKVEINHVNFSFFNNFNLQGVYIEDDKKDTLAYIGNLQLKTSELLSNYWNNENSVIHNATIENANVFLNRSKDSIWNYDFIALALNENSKNDTTKVEVVQPKTEKVSASNPTIDIQNIAFKNVKFYMDDAWVGENMRFAIAELNIEVDELNIDKKKLKIDEIVFREANIDVKEYVGNRPKRKKIIDSTEWGTPFNPDLFSLAVHKITFENSIFNYNDGNRIPKLAEFDESHIGITNLNIELENTKVIADTVFSDIKNLTAIERCGISINEMHAKAKVSQVQSLLSNLLLKTNHSTVTDYYEMRYKNFHDFNDYIDKVRMIASIKNASVSSLDVGYFANILNEYPIAVNIAGDVDGTVKDLSAKNIALSTLNTSFKGNAHVVGLPDIDNTIFDIESKQLLTSGTDLNKLIPQTKTNAVAWSELKKIEFNGTYKGKVDEFDTKGNLNTTLGNAVVDVNMNFKPKTPTYKGMLETDNLQLGKLVKQNKVGILSINGQIDGQGFDINTLDAKINALVKRVDVDGTKYKNLTINGLVSKKKFDGIFVSQDEKLALNFNGKLDLSGKQPFYNFNSRFISINLQKMGITKEPIIASGLATLNFTGDDIDNFTGSALLKNISIKNGDHTIFAEELLLESIHLNNEKILRLTSSIADAEIKGKFNISDLGNAFQIYLSHYLPQYITRPANFKNQAFVFNANVKEADSILKTFVPSFKGITGTTINGELNTINQKLVLDVNIPSIGYNDLKIKDIVLVGGGDFNSLDINATTESVLYNEEIVIPSMQLNSSMANDTASLSINTQSMNDLLGVASINCKATAFKNSLYLNLLPSKISLKNDSWQFYSNQNIVIGKEVLINDVVIENGAQRVTINSENTLVNNVRINLSNIDLESISEYTSANPRYYGRLNGIVQVKDFTKNPYIKATIYSDNEVRIDNDTLGLVKLIASYDVQNQIADIDESTSIERNENFAHVAGNINAKDNTVDIEASLNKQSISFINQFFSDYIENLKGSATGKVTVKGKLNEPKIAGAIKLDNASVKVIFLGTTYTIEDAKLKFNNHYIEMDDFYLKDERNGNYQGLVKGYITHDNFTDFFLNFNVKSSDLLCLNTKENDNELFYGYVPAKINLDLAGELDDINVDIDVKPLKGSKFFLPINSKGDASTYDFVRYKQFGSYQIEGNNKKRRSSYVKLNMNIDATPNAETSIILDANTGEEIVARGNGDIRLVIDLGNSIDMNGTYQITEGKYLFNFRGLFNKEFIIDEGSKIVWNGDALNANMNIKAIYKLPQKKALYPLVIGQVDGADLTEAKRAYPTFVTILMTNSLLQPDIKFDITQPENKAVGTTAYSKLEQIKNNENELIAQAGVLLLLNDFKSSEGLASTNAYGQGAVSTVSDLVSAALSNEITNQFQNITGWKNVSLNVAYQNSTNYTDLDRIQRNEFKFNVTTNLFKDRVILDVGSSVDVGAQGTTNNTTSNSLNGDFKAQVLLTDDGRLRLNTFANNTSDLAGNNPAKGGVGLSYKKSFNSFRELFLSKKKRNQKKIIVDSLVGKL